MKERVSTSGGENLANNPFAALDMGPLPEALLPAVKETAAAEKKSGAVRRGKVHLRIERTGRGGKTVTVIFGEGISQLNPAEQNALLRELTSTLGCGGANGQESGTLELQGDERKRAEAWLRQAGFR